MKDLEVCQNYSDARRIFNSLLSRSSGDGTRVSMLDISLQIFPCFKLIVLITILQNEKKIVRQCWPFLSLRQNKP